MATDAPRRMTEARIQANKNYLMNHAGRRQGTERVKYYKRRAKILLQARAAEEREPAMPKRSRDDLLKHGIDEPRLKKAVAEVAADFPRLGTAMDLADGIVSAMEWRHGEEPPADPAHNHALPAAGRCRNSIAAVDCRLT